jgi:hypothetical protein
VRYCHRWNAAIDMEIELSSIETNVKEMSTMLNWAWCSTPIIPALSTWEMEG